MAASGLKGVEPVVGSAELGRATTQPLAFVASNSSGCNVYSGPPDIGALHAAATQVEIDRLNAAIVGTGRVCECGGEKSGTTHSEWCPKLKGA